VPTLRELQTAMRHGLLDDGDLAVTAVLADALTPADRLNIYRNTSRTTLTKALGLNFPAVRRLVGEEFFAAAADTFITREPPGSAWLDLYGQGFPGFLTGFEPAASLAYLPDVARLERAVGRALHAADAAPLELSTLRNLPASEQALVCFTPHPSLSLTSSPYPVDAIWRAVLAGDEAAMAAIDFGGGDVHLLIGRCGGAVEVSRLEEPKWLFAEALATGHSLASSLETAGNPDAALWLAEQLAAGHFTAFELAPTPVALERERP
jgi:hypothetical protein